MSRATWTPEQTEILMLGIQQGKKVKEIAAELNVSPKRVSNKIQILKNQKPFSSEVEKAKPIPEAAELFIKKRYTVSEMATVFKKQHDKDKAEIKKLREENETLRSFKAVNSYESGKKNKTDEILKQAIVKYGKDAQVKMAIEEMSELTQALCKDFRGKGNAENIAEEIADVEIMIQQLKIIFNNRNDVNRFYELKIKRLKNNLRRSKNDL